MGRVARSSSSGAAKSPPTSGSGAGAGANGKQWRHDLHHRVNPHASRVSKLPTTLSPAVARSLQNNRLFAALHGDQVEVVQRRPAAPTKGDKVAKSSGAANVAGTGGVSIKGVAIKTRAQGSDGGGFSIKGSAGPAVVQASNFAPGTTAEDIKHAFAPLGKITSCIILTTAPTVIAEVVFERKEAGEKCIQQYNGQKADGKLFPPSATFSLPTQLPGQMKQRE
jgi:hypothetical protein